jgi:LacI family transcriptional regulator
VTRTIGLIADAVASEAYAGDLVAGALSAAAARGYLLFVCETGEDAALEERLVEELLARHVDAFLYATYFTRDVVVPPALQSERVVLLNCRAPGFSCVVPDEEAAGRTAAEALLAAGYVEGIWLVGEPAPHVFAAAERLRGIEQSLDAAGARLAGTVSCTWWPESAFEQFGALLDAGQRPAAVICVNDRAAMGVYQALGVRGLRVPDDLSVVSFDDSDLAGWLQPALSSVALPHRELATTAVDLLLGEGGAPPGECRVAMPLRRRRSIAPPK